MRCKRLRVAFLKAVVCCVLGVGSASAQEVALKNGESVDLPSVYWIRDCRTSLLNSFAGVDVLEGPPGFVLSIREEMVKTGRQNWPNTAPGGIVVATGKNVHPVRLVC
jgi:hypothetical protein